MPIRGVAYDRVSRTVVLSFDRLVADRFELRIMASVRSAAGIALGADNVSSFTGITDLSALVNIEFTLARMDRAADTVSYDVRLRNTSTRLLLLPLILELDPVHNFTGEPLGATGRTSEGTWLVDLSDALPDGILRPGEVTVGRTITVRNPAASSFGRRRITTSSAASFSRPA